MEKCRMILFFHFSFDFSISLPDVQRRTLDVAVKNSGCFLYVDSGAWTDPAASTILCKGKG